MVSTKNLMYWVIKISRIMLCYYSDYGETMYDTLIGVLRDNGNHVFRLNINNPAIAIDRWGGNNKIVDKTLIDLILKFNPEIIFNFNNSLPLELYNCVNPECAICVIDADNPTTFWNQKYLKDHYQRVFFLGLQSYSKEMYEQFLGVPLSEKNYLYFPPGTAVCNVKLVQDKNISFIGSNFYPLTIPGGEDFYSKMALDLYDALKKNYYLTEGEAAAICKDCGNVPWLLEKVRAYYVGQDRLKHMQMLSDLGFTYYGVRWWNHIAYYDFELAKCFDSTPKITLEDNQWVYNTSKISVNISHPQAKSSFSWRVMDIMASNSCLLMEDKIDWRNLFEKYLSKQTLDAIIYQDMFDMREKAIKLLNDDKLRQNCVKELNHAIEQNGRWHIRFMQLEKLISKPMVFLDTKDVTTTSYGNDLNTCALIAPELFENTGFILKSKMKIRHLIHH